MINTGTAHASLPAVDIDGQARTGGAAVDMGADEATTVPTLIFPHGSLALTSPTYSWSAVPGAVSYQLYVTDNVGAVITNTIYTAEAAGCPSGSGTCSITPGTGLTVGKSYNWNVRARNGATVGAYSPAKGFTVVNFVPVLVSPIATSTPRARHTAGMP